MSFKLGDRVRTLVYRGNIPIGTHVRICKIDSEDLIPYKVIATNEDHITETISWYRENELELLEDDFKTIKNQVWDLAKKLGSYDGDERVKIFNHTDAYHYGWVLNNYTPDEVFAKIKEYEKKKDINVGDIVRLPTDTKEYIVLDTEGHAISTDFTTTCTLILKYWEKTGRSVNISDLIAVVNIEGA